MPTQTRNTIVDSNGRLETPEAIGLLIRARRQRAGYTQAELADLAGVGRQWLVTLEKGLPGAALGSVLSVLAALGLVLTARQPRVR